MMARLGIDFGSSCTVIAFFDMVSQSPVEPSVFSPNLIHITDSGERITGARLIEGGLADSPATARHLRHYILRRSPCRIGTGGSAATLADAGKDYLVSLVRDAAGRGEAGAEEAVFTVPADAPDHYTDWIGSVAAGSGIREYRIIDEITAACIGYDIPLQAGRTIMVIDFGAEAFEVFIGNPVREKGGTGFAIQIMGRAAANEGGSAIDRWLADECLSRCGTGIAAVNPCRGAPDLFRQAKERLSFQEATTLTPAPGRNGAEGEKTITVTRQDLERVLERHNLYGTIACTIEKAIAAAYARGLDKGRITDVLMTGGGCLIPSVRDMIRHRFGPGIVRCGIPREAVARGAARYSPDRGAGRRISRDYALRYYDPAARLHQYRYIVRRGTVFPTDRAVLRLLITASYDGQTHLGLALFALGGSNPVAGDRELELVSDRNGSYQCIERAGSEGPQTPVWINREDLTLLVATPPATQGEVRFEVTFAIDPAGNLMLTARDVRTGTYVLQDHRVAKLA